MTQETHRNVRKVVFPNGLTLLTESMPHVRSVAMGIWLNTGSRQEAPNHSGITHFIEHMVFKGTKTRSAEQIARSMDSIGGHLDAFTAKEMVCFNAVVLDQNLPAAMDVLSDMVQNPRFDPADISKERGVVLEEIKSEEDNPEYLLHEMFTQKFWKNHPLGRPILGTRRTVSEFARPAVERQFGRFYTPNNMVISVAGHLQHARVQDMVESRFGRMKRQPLQRRDVPPAPTAHIALRDKQSLEQAHFCMGVPAYPLGHERRYGAFLLNSLLGGGMSSRLFQKIREQQGLVYSVFSELIPYRDAGGMMICAGTSMSSIPKLIDNVLAEFRDLKANLITREELKRTKDQLKGSLMLGLESTGSRMSNLARQQMYYGRFMTLDQMKQKIDTVTAEEIRAIARELFQQEKISVSVLGRLNGLKVTRSMLAC